MKIHGNCVQEISFTVPRATDAFSEDLYPACRSVWAALTGGLWI